MKKQNTHHTVRAISTSTIKIVEKGQIYTPNTQIHDRTITWLGTDTSIKKMAE